MLLGFITLLNGEFQSYHQNTSHLFVRFFFRLELWRSRENSVKKLPEETCFLYETVPLV